ncbi:hypothetical protein A2W45_00825 [Candidatus Curtissbacteria bacterium RIFCSPHIGHO2_12_41_11]|uniref:Uncharacterized protein n=2 Tax=Candidatus Curtissiibacteriota TaxID=1752717 RepID=A0A1F5HQY8_9BACT|nr:MAG: hypothetical protein A2Z54_02945 [Candidatus Curtissbacteria bacterium RIFCSPHIGHO2_02_39_8]OGD98679.1 MAG: hypothetical protein A2W45_00825 [Candidatus Curtissbacteria bacterium RIFCSPHIGHO2_12_41_11]OGE06628.1 MAG: hypothetical protein A2W70_04175 [Candidatus Curtissbacteria bacterium RIFCSPLOWO2_02_41_11]
MLYKSLLYYKCALYVTYCVLKVNIPITYEEDIIGWVALNTSQLPDKVCPFTIAISSDVRP